MVFPSKNIRFFYDWCKLQPIFQKKPIKQDEEDYLFSFDYCVIFIPILLGTKSPTVLMGST